MKPWRTSLSRSCVWTVCPWTPEELFYLSDHSLWWSMWLRSDRTPVGQVCVVEAQSGYFCSVTLSVCRCDTPVMVGGVWLDCSHHVCFSHSFYLSETLVQHAASTLPFIVDMTLPAQLFHIKSPADTRSMFLLEGILDLQAVDEFDWWQVNMWVDKAIISVLEECFCCTNVDGGGSESVWTEGKSDIREFTGNVKLIYSDKLYFTASSFLSLP